MASSERELVLETLHMLRGSPSTLYPFHDGHDIKVHDRMVRVCCPQAV